MFIFSKNISKLHGEDDESKTKTRLRTLHSFNLVVFAAFIASLIMNNSAFPDEQISHSSLCLLISYIIYNIADGMILSKYGENISVMGSSRYVETATSRTLELIVLGAVIVTSNNHPDKYLGNYRDSRNYWSSWLPCSIDVYNQRLLVGRFPQRYIDCK